MRLFSRVEAAVFYFDKFFVDVRVNLRGPDVGVSEQFLQYAQVHTRLQAVRRKAMAERMRRNLFAQVHRMQLHYFPGAHTAHRLAMRIQNDIVRSRMR